MAEVVERALDNVRDSRSGQRAEVVLGRVQEPSSALVAGIVPLRMQMQRDLKAIVVEIAHLTLHQVDGRIRAAFLDFFEFCDLDEIDETYATAEKELSELFSPARAHGVSRAPLPLP